ALYAGLDLLILSLSLIPFSLFGDIMSPISQIDCTGFLRPGSGFSIPCGVDYSPICGTNGITYRNKCQFCTAYCSFRHLEHKGKCLDSPDAFGLE
uniref:Ovomucoid n=1 Tax=Zosterops lateralis melanops TaxID=1220523 RepID=A0A8D2NXS1_ZOSLA